MTTTKSPLMQLIEGKSSKEIGGNIYGLQYRADNKLNEVSDYNPETTYRWLKIQEGIEALSKHKVLENKVEIEGKPSIKVD